MSMREIGKLNSVIVVHSKKKTVILSGLSGLLVLILIKQSCVVTSIILPTLIKVILPRTHIKQ